MPVLGIGSIWRRFTVKCAFVAEKKVSRPAWWKNTYFWIAAILFILCILGLIGGDAAIRDPGQTRESSLWLLYLVAAVVMFVNGYMSHAQTVQNYRETVEGNNEE